MDRADRTRYRQLANDAVIATFGESGLTAQLAEALEKCVDELELIATESDVDDLVEELAFQIEETESYVDELEAEVVCHRTPQLAATPRP